MAANNFTIALNANGCYRKITKLLFASDGSYMVMVPYHSANKGLLFKMPVTYSSTLDENMVVPFSEILDAGDVDEKRVKLSHHRSGLLQFSGEGVVSGFDQNRSPRGIGIQSWTLDNPAPGPSFGITFKGLDDFQIASSPVAQKLDSHGIVFDIDGLAPVIGDGFVLEGFYLPPKARRFVKPVGTKALMQIVHPVGIVMDLQVALADPTGCDFPGLVGFTLYPIETGIAAPSGYMMSSSTGNLRKNSNGDILGDGLFCVFPDELKSIARRRLDYVPQSLLSPHQ